MRVLTGNARLAGVVGWPVSHSRSPRLHGHWIGRYGLDAAYVPLPVRPEALRTAMDGLRAAGFAGLNVTIPHKEAVIEMLDEAAPFARRVGAVNTVFFRDGRSVGDNTDGLGFLANLHQHGVDPGAGPALVLGAGGAARAIVAALLDAGAPVLIANRTLERAEQLARQFSGARALPWDARADALADTALLVNTTALGMTGKPPLEIDLARARADLAVADIVYVPLETDLLSRARALGLRAVDGLGMLLHQARPGFAGWFGVEPKVDDDLYRFVACSW
jgi:shikimate dehydrogenase